jgi:glycosyltransferase involved in cell wall biosynthesis
MQSKTLKTCIPLVRHTRYGRILYVIGSLNIGGAERHVTQVAMRLKERGWETEVFVLSPGGPLTSMLTEAGIPIYGVHLPVWISRFVSNERLRARVSLVLTVTVLIKILWFRRPAVLHFFLPAAYIIGGIASLFARVPVRIMSRRSLNNYQLAHPLFARIERFLHPKMTCVCGNSKAVVKQLEDEGVSAQRLRLIYNGIDFTPYDKPFDRTAARANADLPDKALVFVLVANLIPYKGHSDLIKALSIIKDSLPKPWVLLCLGRDDGIGAELQAEAKILGVAENIRFIGSRPDVPVYLQLADVGLLCSHEEGFSNAVLEGMAAGLPMVVTDVGGNAEAVVDEVTGYVVPARNPVLLAQALVKVASKQDRSSMGELGRYRAEKYFSMPACIDAYEVMYRESGCYVI